MSSKISSSARKVTRRIKRIPSSISVHIPFMHHDTSVELSEQAEQTFFGTIAVTFIAVLLVFQVLDPQLAIFLSIPLLLGVGGYLISIVTRET